MDFEDTSSQIDPTRSTLRNVTNRMKVAKHIQRISEWKTLKLQKLCNSFFLLQHGNEREKEVIVDRLCLSTKRFFCYF